MRRGFIAALSCLIFLGACALPGATALNHTDAIARATSADQPASEAGTGRLRPLDQSACLDLREALIDELGVDVATHDASFEDMLTGLQGTACRLIAKGTGSDFGPFVDVAARLATLLRARGWRDEPGYVADGPTSTRMGLSQDNALAILDVGWEPAPGVVCNRPISECTILPGQQRFTITLDLVQR